MPPKPWADVDSTYVTPAVFDSLCPELLSPPQHPKNSEPLVIDLWNELIILKRVRHSEALRAIQGQPLASVHAPEDNKTEKSIHRHFLPPPNPTYNVVQKRGYAAYCPFSPNGMTFNNLHLSTYSVHAPC